MGALQPLLGSLSNAYSVVGIEMENGNKSTTSPALLSAFGNIFNLGVTDNKNQVNTNTIPNIKTYNESVGKTISPRGYDYLFFYHLLIKK